MTFAALAPGLAAFGYDPIPITRPWDRASWILAPGKQPAQPKGWQRGCPRHDWHKYRDCGVGVLARRTPAIDIDTLDEDLADRLQGFIDRYLGEAPIRVGQWPKRLHVFRNDGQPFPKLRLTWRCGEEQHAAEVLSSGQQYVVAGVHPITEQPYRWLRDPDLSLPWGMLPKLDQATAVRFMRALVGVLEATGATDIRLCGAPGPVRTRSTPLPSPRCRDDAERIRAALEHMGNHDLHYDDWIRIGMALKGALGEDGAELFEWWSSLSAKNDPAVTCRKWASFRPRLIAAGTIFFESGRHG